MRTENIQKSVYQGSGEYHIIDHQETDNVGGLLTSLGAKYTTGRKLAALTMAVAGQKLNLPVELGKSKLIDSNYSNLAEFTRIKVDQYKDILNQKIVEHLVSHYGSTIDELMDYCQNQPALLEPICANEYDIMGQVSWAVENEQAQTLSDVIFRRTSVGLLGISDTELGRVANIIAKLLDWSNDKTRNEIDENLNRLTATNNALMSAKKYL